MKEALMRLSLVITVLLAASPALATVGGGDITLKNTGGTVTFSHETHVASDDQKCPTCHVKLYTNVAQHRKVTMKEMQKGKSCGACHNGKTAFSVTGDCTKCHKK
jgi:c(7)-type cytochrome triheme protein